MNDNFEWRPIASFDLGPETFVLIYDPETDLVGEGFICPAEDRANGVQGWVFSHDVLRMEGARKIYLAVDPSHWLPLPPPPISTA